MKKIYATLVAIGLIASSSAYAATDTTMLNQDTPYGHTGIMLELEGIVAQITGGPFNYAQLITSSTTSNGDSTNTITNSTTVKSIRPDYKGAFSIGAGYLFPNTPNDLQFHWTHLNMVNKDSTATSSPNQFIAASANNVIDTSFQYLHATSKIQNTYDAIDLDVGQYINPNSHLQLRLFGGLRYADMHEDSSAFYSDRLVGDGINLIVPNSYTSSYNEAKYSGIGPRFGVDSLYNFSCGFGLAAHVAGDLLVGTSKFSKVSAIDNAGQGDNTYNNTTTDNTTRVVPGLDGKLGLHYTAPIGQGSKINAELGWQVTHYFNAFNNETGLGAFISSNDFGYHGPYLKVAIDL